MAINPMERKTRNSFITGLMIGLFIAALVGVLAFLQIMNINKEKNAKEEAKKSVYVATRDIQANSEIRIEDLKSEMIATKIETSKLLTPSQLTSKMAQENVGQITGKKTVLSTIPLISANNNSNGNNATSENAGNTNKQNAENNNSVQKEEKKEEKKIDEDSTIVAKINIAKGTIVTTDMVISKVESKKLQEHSRLMEYTGIILPTELKDNDTVDVRISFPNGQDLIVVSKKMVEKTDSQSITLKVNEEEIIQLNSALIESYLVEGSKLYAVQYTEPGIQGASKATYTANSDVINLLNIDPNVTQSFKNSMNEYTNKRFLIQEVVAKAKNDDGGDARITSSVNKEKKERQEKRQNYLDGGTTSKVSTQPTTSKKNN